MQGKVYGNTHVPPEGTEGIVAVAMTPDADKTFEQLIVIFPPPEAPSLIAYK